MKYIDFITSKGFAIFLLLVSLVLLIFFKFYPEYYTNWFLLLPFFIFFSISLSLYRRIKARRGRWSVNFVGSVVFHIGMLVVIASICVGGVSRYWVNIMLPRFLPVVVDGSAFATEFSIPFMQEAPFIKMTLDWQDSTFEDIEFAVDHSAGLTIGLIEGNEYKETEETISINEPVWRNGFQFLLRGGGFVYLPYIEDEEGNQVYNEYRRANLDVITEDVITVENLGFEFHVRLFPDMIFEDGKYSSKSREVLNPALGVRIVDLAKPFEDHWKGIVRFDEKIDTGKYIFRFADVRPFISVEILKDPSYYGIIIGWLLIVIGLLMRYLFVKDLSTEIG